MNDEIDRSSTQVLLIEDDPAIQALLSLGLRYEKFHVTSVVDGREGLRARRRIRPTSTEFKMLTYFLRHPHQVLF